MRTTLSHTVLLLTLSLGLAAGAPAFAGGHHGGGNFGGGNKSGMSSMSRNFTPQFSNGSNSGSMGMKNFAPKMQQFNHSNMPKTTVSGTSSHNLNNLRHLNGLPGAGQFGQKGQLPGLGNISGKPIVKVPGLGQGSGNNNPVGNGIGKGGIGFGKGGIGIGIGQGGVGVGVGIGGGKGNCNGPNNNCHHHIGCYPWWKGYGYCGGYSSGCNTVIVQPVTTTVPVLAPELANLPTLQVGAKLTMQSTAFTPDAGVVMLQVDKLMFNVQVDDWQAGAVSFTVPVLMLTGPVKADLVAIDASGNVLVAQGVVLVAAPQTDQTAAVTAQ